MDFVQSVCVYVRRHQGSASSSYVYTRTFNAQRTKTERTMRFDVSCKLQKDMAIYRHVFFFFVPGSNQFDNAPNTHTYSGLASYHRPLHPFSQALSSSSALSRARLHSRSILRANASGVSPSGAPVVMGLSQPLRPMNRPKRRRFVSRSTSLTLLWLNMTFSSFLAAVVLLSVYGGKLVVHAGIQAGYIKVSATGGST